MLKRHLQLTEKQYQELVRVYNMGFVYVVKDGRGKGRNATRLTWAVTRVPRRLEDRKEWDKGDRRRRPNRINGRPVGCTSVKAPFDFLSWEEGPEYISEILRRSQFGLPSRKRDWLQNYKTVCSQLGILPFIPWEI